MPNCLTGTTAKSNKKYVAVPKQFRERWLAAANINKKYSPYTKIFFCQDHFDLDYTFSIAEDVIKVSDHLYITEEVIPRPTSDIQDNSWTFKVRRVPGPIPDHGEDLPVTRPHFNFNSRSNGSPKTQNQFSNQLYNRLSQSFNMSGGDYDEMDDEDDIGDEAIDQDDDYQGNREFVFNKNMHQEFKEEPELNDDEDDE